ncbi:hypothetical protein [Maricaulis sp.]|uniref:hypothetical protein n=1 Tax=Maricaulis sp. TaxID=1486257 RepID=UPI0025BDD3B9|nr:hypothetical protein [Maricaulis sp.]
MSFNRVSALPDHACVEAIIDGYEDWDSATDAIVEMTEMAEARNWSRILIDYTKINLRISLVEAPELAKFFDSFVTSMKSVSVILPNDEHDAAVIGLFANTLCELGHPVAFLRNADDRRTWLDGPLKRTVNG